KYAIEPIETEFEYIGIDKEIYKQSVRRLRQVYDRDIVFREWMENQEIRPVLRAILDEEPVLLTAHHNSIMTKLAHTSTQTCWHRDSRYWHFKGTNLVSVWLALGREYSENGVLEFIPGSHKMELREELFDEKSFFRSDLEENREIIEKKVSLELDAGDIVLFHSELLHRANANSTDEDKISFVYTVKGESVKAIEATRSSKFKEIAL
ncbi:MAG TPA: phytanoyl-CoA dioxygenase family protein, partial [Nitratifractor sp.]|nr:phytanoyl-CoA dioxygenase family protein [Nitratifractor sp.]